MMICARDARALWGEMLNEQAAEAARCVSGKELQKGAFLSILEWTEIHLMVILLIG
jgi:hypothetical protein